MSEAISDHMIAMPPQTDRIKFVNPPINELVVSLFHLPIQELKAQHIGLFWNLIRQKFPICQQQPAVFVGAADAQLFMEMQGEIFPLPRFWFSSDAHPILIQVQRNAFMLNWRRTPGTDAGDYPHYETVVQDFWREFEVYAEFVKDAVGGNLDVIQRCELSYINLISPNEIFGAPSDVQAVLPFLSGLNDITSDTRQLSGLNATISQRINSNLFIDLTIRLGRRSDNEELVLGLDLKAHGAPSDLSLDDARNWYEAAHDATYKLFLDVTSKRIQQELWKRR